MYYAPENFALGGWLLDLTMIYFHHGSLCPHIRSFFNHQYLIFGSTTPFIKAIAFPNPPIPSTLYYAPENFPLGGWLIDLTMIYFHHENLCPHIRSFFNHQYLIFGSTTPFIRAIAFPNPPNIPSTLYYAPENFPLGGWPLDLTMIYFHHESLCPHIRSFFNHQYLIFGSTIPFIKVIAFPNPS
jgi:hypothetical protein